MFQQFSRGNSLLWPDSYALGSFSLVHVSIKDQPARMPLSDNW